MKKEKAAEAAPLSSVDKGKKIFFEHPIRQRIYELFLSGQQFNVVDLSKLLSIPDPRSHIRFLRNAGVPVASYWEKSMFSRYKVYFLHSEMRAGKTQSIDEVINEMGGV